MISMIVAVGNNNEIGLGNQLLWHVPEDLKHFRETTKDKIVVMGRKTFDSIGRPLPNRFNVILTRNKELKIDGTHICHDVNEVLKMALKEEVFIIGGAEIYKLFLPYAKKIYLSKIDYSGPADSYFPTIDNSWSVKESKDFTKFKLEVLEKN